MGMIQEYQCPSCHETWRISTGHGRSHGTFERVLQVFPVNTQKKILDDAKGDPDPFFQFHYRLALCKTCHNIVSVPVFRFLDRGSVYMSGCPKCGSPVTIPEDQTPITCPKCSKSQLSAEEIGCWD
ncbi:MAG: hypothetical protein HFG49_13475 [Lachnospiraceae bacterium]|jgi:predicted RNA-binding Zn-ribbon protein involved in translation (DUF1610 family)|nr:hypothetical protein [Lachnospiraceae bacterium]